MNNIFDIFIEIISLIIGLIGIFYVFMGTKLVDHKLYFAGRLFLWSYIFFILGKLIRILDYSNFIDSTYYRAIPGALFIICLTIAMWYLNKEFNKMVIHRPKQKKRRRR